MIVFLHVQNFMDKLPLIIVFRNFFLQLQHYDMTLQSENLFQLIINFFIFASI